MSTILNVTQGSEAWHRERRTRFTASEAPAMMGKSKHMTRTELLAMKKLGAEKEVSDFVQRFLFDKGHAQEAAARPLVESIICDELFPITAVRANPRGTVELLASTDGATMAGDVLYEHKALNKELVRQVAAKDLEPHYWIQLEQELFCTGAKKVIFATSDGTEENLFWMEYRAVPGRIESILAGWAQFEQDLDGYVHREEAPAVAASAIQALPSLTVQITGEVKQSNLVVYQATALAFIENIKTDLQTDEDFVNADAMVKFCEKAEGELEMVKKHALGQTASIDDLFRTIDHLAESLRQKRLTLEKLVKARKESIKLEVKAEAETKLAAHIEKINTGLGGKIRLPLIAADFATAIKNKRTIKSLRDSVDTELTRAKLAANEIGDRMRANLATLREKSAGFEFLFLDAQELVQKDEETVGMTIQSRIGVHKEQKAAEEEAQREKIRAEERARAEKEVAERAAAEARAALLAEQLKEAARKAAEEQAAANANPGPAATAWDEPAQPALIPVAPPVTRQREAVGGRPGPDRSPSTGAFVFENNNIAIHDMGAFLAWVSQDPARFKLVAVDGVAVEAAARLGALVGVQGATVKRAA